LFDNKKEQMMNDKIIHSEVFDFAEKVNFSSDRIVNKKIIQKPVGNVTLFAFFDEGQELSEHSTPYDALIQVLEGAAQITINKQAYEVPQKSSIIMPANIPHAVKATSRFKMLLTMIKE
jgi:quercetin dioxygenase-like cupin family protein